MDAFWIILAIAIVGALIIGAINRNTQTKVVLAEQERQDKLNSPEYQAQARASLDYFEHLGSLLDYKIWLTEEKIRLFNQPKWLRISKDYKTGDYLDKDYFIASDKKVYQESKKEGIDVRLVSANEITKMLKLEVGYYEGSLKELETEYKKKRSNNSGYQPENLNIIRTKYELDAPLVGDDWVTSSWEMYEEKERKLQEIQRSLKLLEDPATRQRALDEMQLEQNLKDGTLDDDELFQKAVSLVTESRQASASLLQRRLRISYSKAAHIIDEMEAKGLIGLADGTAPRKVLV